MPNNNAAGFAWFLKEYIGGDEEFRQKNRHVLQGLDILSRLEDLYERGRMTADDVRQEVRAVFDEPAKPSWPAEARRAVVAFLSVTGGSSADYRDSYAWLWQEVVRVLEEDADRADS